MDRFEYAYRAEGAYVAAVLSRLAVPTEAVSDAVQDVFVAAYRRWGDFDRSRPVRPWLTGFAHHVAFRYRRSAARRVRKGAALVAVHPRAEPAPSDRVDARVFLERFVEELPAGHRKAFVLAELEGRTAPEIAEALGIGVEAVYGRLRATRRRLRAALLDDGRKPDPKAAALVPPWGAFMVRLGEQTALPIAVSGAAAGGSLKVFATTLALGMLGLGATAMSLGEPESKTPAARVASSEPAGPRDHVGAKRGAAGAGHAPKPTSVEPSTSAPPEAAGTPSAPHAGLAPARGGDPSVASSNVSDPASVGAPNPGTDPTRDPLSAENALILAAKAALADGDPAGALQQLDLHAERFPRGQLVDARRRTRIRALCDLGRTGRARAEAEAFAAQDPNNPLAKQALSICSPIQNPSEAGKKG